MELEHFQEVNILIGKGQSEYVTIPANVDVADKTRPVTFCAKLNEEEIEQIKKTGQVWIQQLTFGNPFQPMRLDINKPDMQGGLQGKN